MKPKLVTKPSFKPTDEEREMVGQCSAIGTPQESIAAIVRDGIDVKTLRKYFRRELDTAATKANAKVGGTLFNKAIGGDTAALIWWTKTRMGWRETREVENTGLIGVTSMSVDDYKQARRDMLADDDC